MWAGGMDGAMGEKRRLLLRRSPYLLALYRSDTSTGVQIDGQRQISLFVLSVSLALGGAYVFVVLFQALPSIDCRSVDVRAASPRA